MRPVRILALLLLTVCSKPDTAVEEQPKLGDSTRLPPSAFADLPDAIRTELEHRRCTIPQSFRDRGAHNVVRGRFISAAVIDIAVLCSRDSTSTILVFHAARADSVFEVATRPDDAFGEYDASTPWRFARALDVADAAYIRSRHERYGGAQPPPLDHDGINDVFVGKASVVWYWNGTRWLALQGAD